MDLKAIESLDLEFTAFLDGGIFWDKMYHPRYPQEYLDRILADAGLGLRFKTRILEKDLYLRFDFPFLIYDDGNTYVDRNNWLISFQRGL